MRAALVLTVPNLLWGAPPLTRPEMTDGKIGMAVFTSECAFLHQRAPMRHTDAVAEGDVNHTFDSTVQSLFAGWGCLRSPLCRLSTLLRLGAAV